MELTIIILNYRQKGLVKYCIRGIQLSKISLDYEIIVVDNHSEDGCFDMLRDTFADVITVGSPSNRGMGAGNNLGIQKARGKYVMIINPDIVIFPGEVEKIFEFMNDHPQVGIAAPKLKNPDGSVQYSSRRFYNWKTPIFRRTIFGKTQAGREHVDFYLMKDFDHTRTQPVDWLFGACLFIRKAALDEVGLFDEDFFIYFEDCDLCRRFWEHGWEVWYVADAELVHYHYRESARRFGLLSVLDKASRNHMVSGMKYFWKYRSKDLPR